MRTAADWVGRGGRARVLRDALVTAERYQVGAVLCVQDTAMKQAWCLATSSAEETAKALMKLYGKRWGIECGFRDTKDLRFGMGMGSIHVSTPARRDRLWLLNAFAIMLLTLLGAAGEALGLPIPQVKHYQTAYHSLFRQGCMLYDLIPNMPEARLLPLIERFTAILGTTGVCRYFRRGVKMRGIIRAEKCHLGFACRLQSEQSDGEPAEQLQEVKHPGRG